MDVHSTLAPRPAALFGREQAWADLSRFALMPLRGPELGVVYGRRRQGKSFLLRALTEATGAIYHQGLEEEPARALEAIGHVVARAAGLSAPLALASWDAAIRALVQQAAGRVIVLDEFPFLAAASPELPSVIQRVFDEARSGLTPRFRLLLCGSAMSVMSTLLSGTRPLRGRAGLQLLVEPFDFREAAAFWKIRDPETAFLVHATVGGTPGYRDLLAATPPTKASGFVDWLLTGVLDPSHALFSEAGYLLTEDPAISDRALYQSTLAAITQGAHTQHEIGGRLGRTDQAMQHPLLVLEKAGFIRRDPDLLLAKRPVIRTADTMLRFHHAVVRPDLARFEARRARDAWPAAAVRFDTQVLGPHFEDLARDWTLRFASVATLGGRPTAVGFTRINDADRHERFELDVVALGDPAPGHRRPVILAIGEAKGGTVPRGMADLARLDVLRQKLGSRAVVTTTRLLLFSRGGFSKDLVAAARKRPDVELVDLARLYRGD